MSDNVDVYQVPPTWKTVVNEKLLINQWMTDFTRRVLQFQQLTQTDKFMSAFTDALWLGGLFSPEAFVAGTRQVSCSSASAD